jgi:phage tail tape-measure protein
MLFVAGCEYGPLARQRVQARQASLHRTVSTLAAREQRSPANLARGGAYARKTLERDAKRLERDARGLGRYLRRDLRRWHENSPRRRRQLERLLRGNPDKIERTAVIMFY